MRWMAPGWASSGLQGGARGLVDVLAAGAGVRQPQAPTRSKLQLMKLVLRAGDKKIQVCVRGRPIGRLLRCQ